MKNKRPSLKTTRELAEAGYKQAQFALALNFYAGVDVRKNFTTAAYWLEKSARQGEARAQGVIGWFYIWGQGVKRNSKRAHYWFMKAARQHRASAEYGLGVMYEDGLYVKKSLLKAKYWWTRAARQGHPTAQLNLAGYFLFDDASSRSPTQSRTQQGWYWCEKAAKTGESAAQFIWGSGLAKGHTPLRNVNSRAYFWLSLAQQNGVKEATALLKSVKPRLSESQLTKVRSEIDDWVSKKKHLNQTYRWLWRKNPRKH